MIPQMAMSREARKILNDLEQMASGHSTSTLVTPSQVYSAEQLALKYFTAPVLNAIKSRMKSMRSITSKHFTIEYWIPILETMFTINNDVKRPNSVVSTIDNKDFCLESFKYITKFLITDYSMEDSEMIYKMIHKYNQKLITDSITIAVRSNVYSLRYINAIIEKEEALTNIRIHSAEKLGQMADSYVEILNKPIQSHTIMDIATADYNWKKAQEDAEIARKFNEMIDKLK